MRPVDAVSFVEAAHILGCTPSTVRGHVLAGRLVQAEPGRERMLSRADVETLALKTYRHRRHLQDRDPYWVTSRRAADILGVNVARLNQLVSKGFLPFETHVDGTRLYRRQQLQLVANSRAARWH